MATHVRSLEASTLQDQQGDGWADRNLIGPPDVFLEKVHAYADAATTTLCGLLFATVDETVDALADFSENVIMPYRRMEAA